MAEANEKSTSAAKGKGRSLLRKLSRLSNHETVSEVGFIDDENRNDLSTNLPIRSVSALVASRSHDDDSYQVVYDASELDTLDNFQNLETIIEQQPSIVPRTDQLEEDARFYVEPGTVRSWMLTAGTNRETRNRHFAGLVLEARQQVERENQIDEAGLPHDVFFLMNEDLLDMFDMDLRSAVDHDPTERAPMFPVGLERHTDCLVCLEPKTLNVRPCCSFPACAECLAMYLTTQVSMAQVKIQCPNTDCKQNVHREEVLSRLDGAMRMKFCQFLADANCEPHRKTCPQCSHILTIDLEMLKVKPAKKYGYEVQCSECGLLWCFQCQAPTHQPMTCKRYRRGDVLLKVWAKEHRHGQANAQKCPKCQIYIQRSSGCDHMTCSKCKTNFCYRCGDRFREFKFIGNHYSKLSIFGCKYRYKPDKPVQRRLIRGSIFGGKLLAAPVLGGLALGVGAIVAGVGLLVLPFYGSYKLHQKLKQRKLAKQRRNMCQQLRQQMQKRQAEDFDLYLSDIGLNSEMFPSNRILPATEELYADIHHVDSDVSSYTAEMSSLGWGRDSLRSELRDFKLQEPVSCNAEKPNNIAENNCSTVMQFDSSIPSAANTKPAGFSPVHDSTETDNRLNNEQVQGGTKTEANFVQGHADESGKDLSHGDYVGVDNDTPIRKSKLKDVADKQRMSVVSCISACTLGMNDASDEAPIKTPPFKLDNNSEVTKADVIPSMLTGARKKTYSVTNNPKKKKVPTATLR